MTMAGHADRDHQSGVSIWSSDEFCSSLLNADAAAFAWEWLRRSQSYRSAFAAFARNEDPVPSLRFGLERYEHPGIAVPEARPIWGDNVSRDVIRAHVSDPFAASMDRVDLRLLSNFVTVAIGADEVEHVLLTDGTHSIRIDVVVGTLIGCPAALTYLLHGISGLKGPIGALERLRLLITTGRFSPPSTRSIDRRRRWIDELRVADALAEGHNQQRIARALFGGAVATQRWRIESAPHRRRVQRLAATARWRLRDPLRGWFDV
jgi:hypothetical protein